MTAFVRWEKLGFLMLKPYGSNPTGFAFIPNPHPVILGLHEAYVSANSTEKAKLPKLREETFTAFLVRATDIKAADVMRLQKTAQEARDTVEKVAAATASAPKRIKLKFPKR